MELISGYCGGEFAVYSDLTSTAYQCMIWVIILQDLDYELCIHNFNVPKHF